MKKLSISLCATAILALAGTAALPAHAEGLYVGGNVGAPHFGDSVNGIDGSGSGVSGKLYGGYQFTPNFSLEAGIADLGKISSASGDVKGHAPFVDAVGTLPIARDWSLLGRIGVAHVDLNTSNGDDNSTSLKVGLGAQYSLSANTALRGEWERYRPDTFGTHTDIDQYSVGLRVSF